jgi:hypothetical protein
VSLKFILLFKLIGLITSYFGNVLYGYWCFVDEVVVKNKKVHDFDFYIMSNRSLVQFKTTTTISFPNINTSKPLGNVVKELSYCSPLKLSASQNYQFSLDQL